MSREPYQDKLEPDEERRLELSRDRARAVAAAVRWASLTVILTLLVLGWLCRWNVTPTTGGEFPTAIVLDRLTGDLFYVQQNHSLLISPRP
jgi:hypothetical protein